MRFAVHLDPASVEFPFIGYNVRRIRILHKRTGVFVPVEIASVDATDGQVDFDLQWNVDVSSVEAGAIFFAFVETVLPSVVDLEIAEARLIPTIPGLGGCLPAPGLFYCASAIPDRVLALTDAGSQLTFDGISYRTLIDGVSALLPQGLRAVDMNEANEILVNYQIPDPGAPGLTLDAVGVLGGTLLTEVANASILRRPSGVALNDRGDVAIDAERAATSLEDQQLDRSTMGIGVIARRNAGVYQRQAYIGAEFEEISLVAFGADDTAFGSRLVHDADGSGTTRRHLLAGLAGTTPFTGLPSSVTEARMNAHGDLVASGAFPTDPLPRHGWFVRGGIGTRLMDPPDATSVEATDVNDDAVIVGRATNSLGLQEAWLWSGPTALPRAISAIVDPAGQWTIQDANLINDAGVIAGFGRFLPTGQDSPVLLVPATRANLSISIIAPAEVAPGAAVTYAVNLQNFGPAPTTDMRAEFLLPDGFTIVGTVGWQACETTTSTVVCRSESLSPGEQRAFLVDVQAPLGEGEFVVSARALSGTPDPDFANNERTATTVVAAPP